MLDRGRTSHRGGVTVIRAATPDRGPRLWRGRRARPFPAIGRPGGATLDPTSLGRAVRGPDRPSIVRRSRPWTGRIPEHIGHAPFNVLTILHPTIEVGALPDRRHSAEVPGQRMRRNALPGL